MHFKKLIPIDSSDPISNREEEEESEIEQCIFVDLDDSSDEVNDESGLNNPKRAKSTNRRTSHTATRMEPLDRSQTLQKTCNCQFCGKQYFSPLMLKFHIENDHPNFELYLCNVCERAFPSHSELKVHMSTHEINHDRMEVDKEGHGSVEAIEASIGIWVGALECYWCNCNYTTSDVIAIKNHIERHIDNEDVDRFLCRSCPKSFASEFTFIKHNETCSKVGLDSHKRNRSPSKPFECYWQGCGYATTDDEAMRCHAREHILSEKIFDCEDCPKSFRNESDFREHIKSHAFTAFFECNCCDKAFTQPGFLANHSLNDHTDEEVFNCQRKPFKCGLCQMIFAGISKIKEHMKKHVINNKQVYEEIMCVECGKPCSDYTELKAHKAVHFSETSFKCYICQAVFTDRKRLREHVKVPHDRYGAIRTRQPGLIQRRHQSEHSRVPHGSNGGNTFPQRPPPVRNSSIPAYDHKPFECTINGCGKRYALRVQLTTHIRIKHIYNERYVCPHCPYKTGNSSHLKYHVLTHSTEKPFECPIENCKTRFGIKRYLQRHMKHVHALNYQSRNTETPNEVSYFDTNNCTQEVRL